MANKPPTTSKERWVFRSIFITAGVAFLALSWIGFYQAAKKELQAEKKHSDDEKTIRQINNNQTNLQNTFRAKFDNLQSNLLAFQSQQREIEMALATNSTYSPSLREGVITTHEKLEDLNLQAGDLKLWIESLRAKLQDREAMQRIAHEKDLKSKQDHYASGFGFFDYAVVSLTNMIEKVAEIRGDTVESDFKGTPTVIDPDRLPLNIGDFRFHKSRGLEIQTVFDPDEGLRIHGCDGSQISISYNGSSELRVPGLPNDDFTISTNDYKQALDERLRLFIAYQDIHSPNTSGN